MWGSSADAFFVTLHNALKYISYGEQKAYDGSHENIEAQNLVLRVKHCGVFRRIDGCGESNFGNEVDVDHGEENESKVCRAYHAAGREDNDDCQGVELPEGEQTGFALGWGILAGAEL